MSRSTGITGEPGIRPRAWLSWLSASQADGEVRQLALRPKRCPLSISRKMRDIIEGKLS